MYLSPTELRALIREVPIELVEIRPRTGVSKEGVSFAMGHEVLARFDGADVVVTIDPTRVAAVCRVHWSFAASIPPITLVMQRRGPGVTGRGVRTGTRGFDKIFAISTARPLDVGSRVFDRSFAEQLVTHEVCVLDGVIGIGDAQAGVPGFGVFFRVPQRPDAVAESFEITRELRTRIFAPGLLLRG